MRQIPQERRRKKHGWKMETILFLIDDRMSHARARVCVCGTESRDEYVRGIVSS